MAKKENKIKFEKKSLNHRPKYVAATATIRGAERDAKLMFGRDMNIFPPPVNYASDNFFAQESSISEEPGRIHLSILGPPKKSRTLGDQPIASALQSVQELTKKFENVTRGKLKEVADYFLNSQNVKGEIVILLSPAEKENFTGLQIENTLTDAMDYMPLKDAVNFVSKHLKVSKKIVYKKALEIKNII